MSEALQKELYTFIINVLNGTNLIQRSDVVWLKDDSNPEWFNYYNRYTVKLHTSGTREGLSGMKIVTPTSGEHSFFNLGAGHKTVGPSRAIKEYTYGFPQWTACLTWEQAGQFLAKMLQDSKTANPPLKRS